MSMERGAAADDMFMRILARRQAQFNKKQKKECPDCGREIAVFDSGKFYPHTCDEEADA